MACEEFGSDCETSRIGLDVIFDIAGQLGVGAGFLAFWDFAFERFVIP